MYVFTMIYSQLVGACVDIVLQRSLVKFTITKHHPS
jgi:hypothetical protein